jgi:3-oxoacyl-[acyl-carrier-protein] synthase II
VVHVSEFPRPRGPAWAPRARGQTPVPAPAGSGPVITAWSAISPWGLSAGDFADGVRSGRPTAAQPGPEWNGPAGQACLVPGFDITVALGKKGTRSMDRATALAVAAVDRLLSDGSGGRLPGIDDRAGLALGTSTGSVQSTMEFTCDSLTSPRPYLVDPARFPNTVMNCAAGQSAIWHRLRGPNATIAAGRATGLLALQYALRLQWAGRAEALVCGAVEEYSGTRAWLAWHAREDGAPAQVLGEGSAIWLLERAASAAAHGRPGIARVAGLEFGFAADHREIFGTLTDCLGRLLERTGIRPGDIRVVAESGAAGADGAAEHTAVAGLLEGHRPRLVSCAEAIGDSYAASAAFQVAAALAIAQDAEPGTWSPVLVTSAESGGVVGAALLRSC